MSRGHIRDRSGPKGPAWEVRAYAGTNPETGKPRIISRTVRTGKRDAQRVLNQILTDIDKGVYGGPVATMADLFERWRQLSVADCSRRRPPPTRSSPAATSCPPSGRWPCATCAPSTSNLYASTVAGRLGHSNASTTLNVYAHFQPAADRAAAELLGRPLYPSMPASTSEAGR